MKSFTFIFLMLLASVSFAQNAPITFEPGEPGNAWTWTPFENDTNPAVEIIANPDPSGANTSATVAKYTALATGNPWAGFESLHGADLGPFAWDATNTTVKVMVWKSVISDVGIKFASNTGWALPEVKVPNTLINQWEEITFNLAAYTNPPADQGVLDQIILFPDFNLDGRGQDNIVYFDNITFNPATGTSQVPLVAAPTPPARNIEDVVNVFSGAYDQVQGTDFNPNWGQSTVTSIIDIEANATLRYANFNYQGTQFASPLNVSAMQNLHVDMWTGNATTVNIFAISTGPVEVPFSLAVTPSQWVSYDIPLTAFAGVNLEDVIQFKFDGGDGSPTIYLDNLYFYRDVTSVSNLNEAQVRFFPNPAKQGQVVQLDKEAEQLEVFDLAGKRLLTAFNTAAISTDNMNQSGIYIIKMRFADGTAATRKLVLN